MLELGPLAFQSPWILLALFSLPAIWWLLRVTPPAPKRIQFPPARLLQELEPPSPTSAKTPLWLLIARLLLAALLIAALAQPILHPQSGFQGQGPLLLVIDDGWAAAKHWEKRQQLALDLIDRAGRDSRAVLVITTARKLAPAAEAPRLGAAAAARAGVAALNPKPWGSDRGEALRALDALDTAAIGLSAETIWLTDGLDDSAAFQLAERLHGIGPLQVIAPDAAEMARVLRPPRADAKGLSAVLVRAQADDAAAATLVSSAEDGRVLARQAVAFAVGQKEAEAVLDLPIDFRNEIARLEIEGEATAGATALLDERWRRRPVGLVGGGGDGGDQPLLSELFYLERALAPFTDVRGGRIGELLERELSLLALADVGQLSAAERALIEPWIEQGGMLVRFAGPRFATNADDLAPVALRGTARQLGGAMSWAEPAKLAPFAAESPFAGLSSPPDVVVRRQVLAEPSVELGAKTWAELSDGTPLVTAERRGRGWLILFHTTANAEWSNLALTGLFVDMLRRLVDLSQGVGADAQGAGILAPYLLLDGFARLQSEVLDAQPIAAGNFAATLPGPKHPPGYFGTAIARRALNLGEHIEAINAITRWPQGVKLSPLDAERELDLRPLALSAALVLALADLMLAYHLRGLTARPLRPRMMPRRWPSLALALGLLLAAPAGAQAQATQSDTNETGNELDFAIKAAQELRLAYVLTGVDAVDQMSRAGLFGLGEALYRRSAVEPGMPMGIDLERHDLAFFPFLYWPMVAQQRALSDAALARLNTFLKTGGLLVLDARDELFAELPELAVADPKRRAFVEILERLDLGPLVPMPGDHVLTKSFYLLREFPGRHAGATVWVERHPGDANDGVSALVVGGNDWAAAWAIDPRGEPLAALPGGLRQRESAYRFGVNLVMYALTGNYKADQVHVPALLERLGQ